MRPRTAVLWALCLLLVGLSGCQGTDRVALEASVEAATSVEGGWRFDVAVRSDRSSTDHRWSGVVVTGHDADGDRICEREVGAVDPGSTERATLTCERLPLVFAVRSDALGERVTEDYEGVFVERIGRESGTDTLLTAEGAAVRRFGASGPEYGSIPSLAGGVSELEVTAYDYATCRLLASPAERSDFRDPVPWLDRDPGGAPAETTVVVESVGRAPVRVAGEALQPVALGTGNATDRLAAAVEAGSRNGTAASPSGPFEVTEADRNGTSVTFRYTGTADRLEALHAALLASPGNDTADVDLGNVSDRADDGLAHAAGFENLSLEPYESCAETPFAFEADGTAGAVYAVRFGNRSWTVTVTSTYRSPTETDRLRPPLPVGGAVRAPGAPGAAREPKG